MAANSILFGTVANINTTGTVFSNNVMIKGWVQTRYSTGAATISTGSVVVERVNKVKVIGAKGAAGQTVVVMYPTPLKVKGLSCTSLVAGTTVAVYFE